MSEKGLTEKEVIESRKTFGENTLTRKKRKGFFLQYLATFDDPVIRILLVALAVNVLFSVGNSDFTETVGIVIAVLLSTLVSTLSQYGSESAFEELEKSVSQPLCRVRREGSIREIPAREVVVGDLVLIQAGEKIPADGVLVSGKIAVDQSALNGESAEAEKIPAGKENDLSSESGLFAGTIVTAGEGEMKVKKVGNSTFYGKLARDMQEESPPSPLKIKLTALAKTLSRIGYLCAVLVAFADLFNSFYFGNGKDLVKTVADFKSVAVWFPRVMHAITLAIAIVVVAVPEGLPMMIAVVLSANMRKMFKDGVLVRKPVGIETAGGLNVLFTDKTGTLTKGKPEVVRLVTGEGKVHKKLKDAGEERAFLYALCAHLNSGSVFSGGKPTGGNATDRAILKSAVNYKNVVQGYSVIDKLPFDSANKYAKAVVSVPNGGELYGSGICSFFTGAPEILLPRCEKYVSEHGEILPFSSAEINAKCRALQKSAMRIVVVAFSPERDSDSLVFLALVGIRDDLRKEVPPAVKEVLGAGVKIVVITGDNPETAQAVARDAGILNGKERGKFCVTGAELSSLSDEEVGALLPNLKIVARAMPTDKSRLVKIAQKQGFVVGMTGDGINDAGALKMADVGFAVGSGTEVAKEAGDIVILDDNFASIAKAIRYGRTVFRSICKFVVFQLTMNFCAVGVSLLAPFIGVDTPVTVVQMLWINIIMDTLAGLAFAGEPPLTEYMRVPPVKRDEPVLGKKSVRSVLFGGVYTVALCLFFLKLPAVREFFRFSSDPTEFYTAFFALFVFSGIFNAFHARTDGANPFAGLWSNKTFTGFIFLVFIVQILLVYFGGIAFRTCGLPFLKLVLVLLLSSTVLPVGALGKKWQNRKKREKREAKRLSIARKTDKIGAEGTY